MYVYEDQKPNGKVDIWDTGPTRPTAPDAPAEPKKTGRGADDAVAAQEYEDALAQYKKDLKAYTALKREYDEYRANVGGALKIEMWPIDANDCLLAQGDRYFKDLPAGAKTGKGQAAADEAAVQRAEETKRIKERDPHMGKGSPS